MKQSSRPSLTTRLVRAGLAGLVAVTATAGLATGCLDRPVSPLRPNTTNIVVEQIQQDRVDKIDLLFMIDNSISMADKQQILSAAVPELVRRLVQPICINSAGAVTGNFPCADPDSKEEFEPVIDIHIGVLTSSLGGHGGNVCDDVPPRNDKAHLIGDPAIRPTLAGVGEAGGYLWWNPGDVSQIGGAVGPFTDEFRQHVVAAGEDGCGFEATLESWYRFLADPEPPSAITFDGSNTIATRGPCGTPEADSVICDQRAQFLRPDSLVAVIMLSDENDCSIRDSDAGWYVSDIQRKLDKGTTICESDPNNQCCTSCADTSTIPGCDKAGCPAIHDDNTDKVNLRCWDQKRRFGIDFLYPTERYVTALRSPKLCTKRLDLRMGDVNGDGLGGDECNPETEGVANPLFTDLTGQGVASRSPALVYLAGIVGVPWQDIATDATLNDPAALEYMTAAQITATGRWDWITGDSQNLPADPLMVETPLPRSGTHPLNGDTDPQNDNPAFDPKGADSTSATANSINGHEWNADQVQIGDLQYACIFPLTQTRDCEAATGGCDCKGVSGKVTGGTYTENNPLCQDPATGQYSSTQHFAKGYPGLRELAVLRGFGDNSIVASICPKITDPNNQYFGYNPAVAAIIDRLKEALGGRCLPRKIVANNNGTPEDPADDFVPCKVTEARYLDGAACDCNYQPGRISLLDPTVEGGADLDKAVKAQLQKDNQCGGDTGRLCENYCVCLVQPYAQGTPEYNACLDDAGFEAENGWCYVDPLPTDQGGQEIGNPAIVENCGAEEKRLLRYEPVAGSIGYIACQGQALGAQAQ